jgi:3-hydroxyisobutyrate dehydrogenase
MDHGNLREQRLGWVGTGRMGYPLASRLLGADCDVAVYNRTRSKAEPLAELGATIVDSPRDLADRDIVFTIVSGPDDFKEVLAGDEGLLSRPDASPRIVVDSTTISPGASETVRLQAAERGTELLAAPVSGNPRVVETGRLTFAVSGAESAYEEALPYLELLGAGATYVGEGDRARLVKICHNLMLGVVAQTMAEVAVLAEKGGISRASLFDFLNNSVMGSMFTRYKTPAYVNLDPRVSFTPLLLRKDFDLGFEAARELDVPMPVAAAAQQVIQSLIGSGYRDTDFATLLELQAKHSDLELEPENAQIGDGLGDPAEPERRLSARQAS